MNQVYKAGMPLFWHPYDDYVYQAPSQQVVNALTDKPIRIYDNEGGGLKAMLSASADGLREVWITNETNGSCILEFELPANCDKWQYIDDKHYLAVDGRHFRLLTENAITFKREGRVIFGAAQLHETWVLLGRKYATISNDPQNLTPAWGAVRVLSGGADLSGGRFIPGTAGHALVAVLGGSGWELDSCDVSGTHDLETEKETVLSNVNAIQEKWGGILIWDSAAKKVSLRDEEHYQNYHGFGVRYAKNEKGITREDDYKLVTRLYPFGENDLNIASVNDGLLYLDDFSHTTEVLEGTYQNAEITDAAELKVLGQKELAKLCKPRHYYETELVDLSVFPEHAHERFGRDDIVDLIDEELGIKTQVRVIRHRYNVLQRWQCEIGCGDRKEKVADMIASSLMTSQTVDKTVLPDSAFQNFLKGVINNAATRINNTTGSYSLVDGQSLWVEMDLQGDPTGKQLKITPAGMAISANGGETWQTAITGEGIYGQVIVAGSIMAGQIAVGVGQMLDDELADISADMDNKVTLGEAYNYTTITAADGVKVENANTNLRLYVNGTQGFLIQKKDGSSYLTMFQADPNGDLTVSGASIVGGTMTVGSGNNLFKASGSGIQLGHANFENAPFSVDMQGNLIATKADVKGDINCTSLAINGASILVDNKINGGYIAARTIDTDQLAANSITTSKIAADAVTAAKVAAGAIETEHLVAGAVTAVKINTTDLAAEKIYKNGDPTSYGNIGGNNGFCDFRLYSNASGGNYFSIVDQGTGGGRLLASGYSFLNFTKINSVARAYPKGTWDFSDATVTGLTAVFG